MHIKRLRLVGFKSFVEPTELLIEPGLTGVVGPNGCGKSNLLEALRWVMGETSHKSMRAASMDDVIFSGTAGRPARNHAEVMIQLDNQDRTAPSEWNDADQIEVARRIEREMGSAYHVNGRDVRARDVKLLFEDAATGARSPSLVRQGQIAEIVNAKPEQRRRVLEDAAGTAGLHSRRHDAELRLKAADTNLARVADIAGQLESQISSLKRQARAARRYKEIAAEIRQLEAIDLYQAWLDAQTQVDNEEAALLEVLRVVGLATELEAKAIRVEIEAAEALPPLREEEARRAAALQLSRSRGEELEREEKRVTERQRELTARADQIAKDREREVRLVEEASSAVRELDDERSAVEGGEAATVEARSDAEAAVRTARENAEAQEGVLATAAAELATARTERSRVEAARDAAARRRSRSAEESARIELQLETAATEERPDLESLRHRVDEIERTIAVAETALQQGEAARLSASAAFEEQQRRAADARLDAARLATEVRTLDGLFASPTPDAAPSMLDRLKVAPGYEAALGAALGDDLEASADAGDPVHWRLVAAAKGDPRLPHGVEPLTAHVDGPPEIARRLAQIGLVEPAAAPALLPKLEGGQCLVSRAGDLWRWDGFTAAAGAATAAAARLMHRSRLLALAPELAAAETSSAIVAAAAEAARTERAHAIEAENRLRSSLEDDRRDGAEARDALQRAERLARDLDQRLETLRDAGRRLASELAEHDATLRAIDADAATPPNLAALESALGDRRVATATIRGTRATAEAALAGIERDSRQRQTRLDAIAADGTRWQQRRAAAEQQIGVLDRRLGEARAELDSLAGAPGRIATERVKLHDLLKEAERVRAAAADALARAETRLKEQSKTLREAQSELIAAREGKARIEAKLEAARDRRGTEARRIRDLLGTGPDGSLAAVGIAGETLPAPEEVSARLARLRDDRDRLGGVNLRAEEELAEVGQQHERLQAERTDLEAAIARLRQAIQKLNREGKARLEQAFETVNGHFQRLFSTLFGGGEASLEMIDGEDPLEGGLEIIAKPPGKKPATLSLLSGGEQTLTALALIFAVFLTNPSPICVLDEVDAPLDDANVDRFCLLMEEMAGSTRTRFLVITHHPMTMSRMDRLYGVTMAEKGVSQLVSVDLAAAERFREAV